MAKKTRTKKYNPNKITTPAGSAQPQHKRAGLLRRLGAFTYDALLAISLASITGGLGFAITQGLIQLGWLDIAGYQDTADFLSHQLVYQLLVWGAGLSFHAWFWTHGGQTVGMRAWRLKIQCFDGSPISLTQALIRLATATFGLGNLQVLFGKEKMAFQDHWAKCEVVVLSKEENKLEYQR